MNRVFLFAAGLSVAVAARGADFSVNAFMDFLSDVKTTLAQYDKNGDGMLDREELGDRAWMLMVLDKDHDGKLSEQELRLGTSRMSRSLFQSRAHAPSTEATPLLQATLDPVRGPRPMRGADGGIGRLVKDAMLTTLDGKEARLSERFGTKGTVMAVISPSCPVSKKYLPVLARIEKEYAARGIRLVGIAPPGEDDVAALRDAGLAEPVLRDLHGDVLRELGAMRSADVFALDGARTLIYRGAVDDQYGLGYSLDAPRQRLLVDALEALLIDRRPTLTATEAPGCELELKPAATVVASPETPTWNGRISRLVQASCVRCHRSGGAAPFPLETYAQALKKAGTIKRVVTENVMPPWFAPAPLAGQHTMWLNDASLTTQDKTDLLAWLENGRPEGDAKDAPRPLAWPEGWILGKPDQVFQIPQPIAIKAEGTMPYQSIMVDTGLTEDKWVTGWEVRPTAPQYVHHVLVYVYRPGSFIPGADERRGHLADYTPGSSVGVYADGMAKALPKGSKLRFEIHYTPNGKPAQDQTMIGLKYASQRPEHEVEIAGVANVQLSIPPGAAWHPEGAAFMMPDDARILSLTPHMHVRGKAMRFDIISPDGVVQTLLDLPRYDFNWQIPAQYAEPPLVKKGTLVRVTGWFDNSTGNKGNPNPQATVHWGSQTDDEMMIGYVEFYRVK